MDTYLHPEPRLHSKAISLYETLKDFHLNRMAKEYQEQASFAKQDTKGFTNDGFGTSVECGPR